MRKNNPIMAWLKGIIPLSDKVIMERMGVSWYDIGQLWHWLYPDDQVPLAADLDV